MSRYLIALTALALLPAAQAGELGRLFNTPQQRQQMEMQGANNGSNVEGGSRNYIIVNGVVQKQGGKRTVWINGAPQTSEYGNDRVPASVPVLVPGKSNPVQLKVGQKLLLDTPAPDSDESKPAEKDD